ncbi:MAG: hypothetical protein GC181_09375 [Bacteroidetes bacterium]|nr:hypothetical protein [Bacteroidota bacterium]
MINSEYGIQVKKIFTIHLIFCLALVGVNLLLEYTGLIFTEVDGELRINRFVQQIIAFVTYAILWISLLITGDKKVKIGSMVALVLSLLSVAFRYSLPIQKMIPEGARMFIGIAMFLSVFVVFGFLVFGKKGLGMIVPAFIIYGLVNLTFYFKPLYRWISDSMNMDESWFSFLIIKFYQTENSWREVDILEIVFDSGLSLLILFVFVSFYLALRSGNSVLKEYVWPRVPFVQNRFRWSVWFLMSRMLIGTMMLGILFRKLMPDSSYSFEMVQPHKTFFDYFLIATMFFALIFYAFYFRNGVTLFHVRNRRTPGVLYFFLYLPFVHIIAWIISLFLKKKERGEAESIESWLDLQQRTYETSNRNLWFKFLLVLAGIINVVRFMFSDESGTNFLIGLSLMIINFVLILVYIQYEKIMWWIVGSQVLIYFVAFALPDFQVAWIPSVAILNSIIMYPLLHFDKMKLGDTEVEESESEVVMEEG